MSQRGSFRAKASAPRKSQGCKTAPLSGFQNLEQALVRANLKLGNNVAVNMTKQRCGPELANIQLIFFSAVAGAELVCNYVNIPTHNIRLAVCKWRLDGLPVLGSENDICIHL